MELASPANPKIKYVVKLRNCAFREETGEMIVEGFRECRRALDNGYRPHAIFHCPDLYLKHENEPQLVDDCAARGAEGLKDAIDFLIAGCGADLQSSSPSMEAAALGRILTDLQCVQVLQTVLDALTALGKRMDKQFGETCLLDGEQMAGRVLDFTEQSFVASPGIAAFIADCGLKALLARMDFARELTGLFRKLSPRLFAREGDRQKLVDAAQEHLDELITEENDAQGGVT